MAYLFTASWSATLSRDMTAVGISRSTPRNRRGYRRLRALEPGNWFRSVQPAEYVTLYRGILDCLDPAEIRDQLLGLGPKPVMLCWESAEECQAGRVYCHRHLVARWLEQRLGIQVPELGHPNLDRFALLRNKGIGEPDFRTAGPRNKELARC